MGVFGIKGEPKGGIIAKYNDEGVTLKYNPNTQIITFHQGKEIFDSMDCSHFNNWDDVEEELKNEYGWDIRNRKG